MDDATRLIYSVILYYSVLPSDFFKNQCLCVWVRLIVIWPPTFFRWINRKFTIFNFQAFLNNGHNKTQVDGILGISNFYSLLFRFFPNGTPGIIIKVWKRKKEIRNKSLFGEGWGHFWKFWGVEHFTLVYQKSNTRGSILVKFPCKQHDDWLICSFVLR